MSDENKLPEAADAQDTRTRKTVKLRSSLSPISQDLPVSDPLASRDTDTGNLEILDDTQTRKTLKLKPMSPGNTTGPKLNLSGSDDTQTRKTVLLRPAAPQFAAKTGASAPATVRLDAEEVAAALEENAADDQTRAVPRPAAAPTAPQIATLPPAVKSGGDDQTQAVPRPAAAPAAPQIATLPPAAKAGSDDQTQAVPRPAAAPGGVKLPGVPAAPKVATLPPAAKSGSDDQTQAVPRPAAVPGGVKLPETAEVSSVGAEDSEDKTVKMKRPPRLGPPPVPAPAPAAALRPPVAGEAKATIKLGAAPKPPTAVPQAAAAPKPPTAVPAAAASEAAPAPEAEKASKGGDEDISLAPSKKNQENAGDGNEEISLAPSKRHQETAEDGENASGEAKGGPVIAAESSSSPSLFYLILAVATLLFVACACVITSVHYLYFEQQMDYREVISVLPNAK